ncbi:MAG TPA: hypothetical protein VFZ21_26425 [Gemmatimonadaceae bacterium]|nr:hypothetical protein [Gemmatimonadaceae bacterium]
MAAAQDIFAILFILSIPLLPLPHSARSRNSRGEMTLGGPVAMPIWRDDARSR